MRYRTRAVFNRSGVVGFAVEIPGSVWMYYTIPRPDIIELHNTPNDQPSAASLDDLSANDFPEYVRGLLGQLRLGEAFITDDLPVDVMSRQDRLQFSNWFRAKAKTVQV